VKISVGPSIMPANNTFFVPVRGALLSAPSLFR